MLATILALSIYVATAAMILRQPGASAGERWLPPVALTLHGFALTHQIFHGDSITIGVNEALSLFTWQSALLLWALCFREPLRVMGVAIYPAAGFAAILASGFPTEAGDIIAESDWKARTHIMLSLFSAGLLTLAAVHASLLAVQERLLRGHQVTSLARALPPLQTMERILFQMIAIGFFLLSLTLLSGLWFIRDWMAQHLAHKTVLSISAWLIFGVLLWGRMRYGWRGRAAIRWTLSGYAVLILAYFGSKLILEQFLGQHWS
ncbi:MAG: cytochrome c biogenesis protein CcsA [Nevskiales bacterium]|nr:cytochrome c biogenesis protein CcsA [Nevskiales bacterium]